MNRQNQQGTGKHGHKDTQEPYPHRRDQQQQQGGSQHQQGGPDRGDSRQQREEGGSSGQQQQQGGSQRQQGGSGRDSLDARQYRDEQGNVHHHTKSYMDQHKGGDRSNDR